MAFILKMDIEGITNRGPYMIGMIYALCLIINNDLLHKIYIELHDNNVLIIIYIYIYINII